MELPDDMANNNEPCGCLELAGLFGLRLQVRGSMMDERESVGFVNTLASRNRKFSNK